MSRFFQQCRKTSQGQTSLRRAGERGVALLITLALLALLAAASLAVILLTDSDLMINGYYRNFRGSFYAADSGANIAVEAIKNAVVNTATPTAAGNPLPISGTLGSTAGVAYDASTPAALSTALAPFESTYYTIGDSGSWSSQFEVVSSNFGQPTYTYACNSTDSNCPADADYIWTFSYPYTVTVQGQSSGTGSEQITETGTITYSSSAGTSASGGNPSFSKWAAFITNFALCPAGSAGLVPGTMYGPFFTDGSWNFGNFSNPGYTFNGTVQQAGSQVGYINNGNCTPGGATAPSGFRAPTYNDGPLQTGANALSAPVDQSNQLDAVLNGEGTSGSNTSMAILKTISGTAYPSTTQTSTAPQGVYIPYYTANGQNYLGSTTTGATGTVTIPAGGFYVNGDASVTLSATGTTSDPTQTYTISQTSTTTTGSGRNQHTTTTTTTTTIVVNPTTNTTTVSSGGTALTLSGIPQQVNPVTGEAETEDDPSGLPVNPTMVYVNGNATLPTGTVQNDMGITVTATSGVSITGDLTYLQSPVSNSDVLNSTTNAGVLGIYTPGNITLSADSQGNLTTDASLAALSGNGTSGTSGFETSGSINNWTILGGRAEDEAHGVSISSSTTLYDQRFANNFGPPWFPTATITSGTPTIPATPPQITVTRTSWTENSR